MEEIVRDWMHSQVAIIEDDVTCRQALERLLGLGMSALVVVKKGTSMPEGIITKMDMLKALSVGHPPHTPIITCMTDQLVAVEPTTLLLDAIKEMTQKDLKWLPVIEFDQTSEPKLVGLLTCGSILSKVLASPSPDEAARKLSRASGNTGSVQQIVLPKS